MLSLLLPVGFLITASLTVLSSISTHLFLLQLFWVVLGIILIFIFSVVDWRSILNNRWLISFLYGLGIIFLVIVYFKGPVIRSTRSWLVLGPFNFQPVELMKLSLILLFGRYFSRRHLSVAHWKNIITSFFYFFAPAVLIALQPDMGSASVLFVIWFGFLIASGLPLKRLAVAVLIFISLGFIGWHLVLKDYQRDRIVGIFYPQDNSLSVNYSLNQAKIAIGSAGLFGKGYGQGTQTQLGFLTEPSNDFILASLIEEWGLVFGILVIAAFLFLLFKILKIASLSSGNFEKFICLGTVMVFCWQFFLNVGSTIGLSPVIGVTFPFLSYGGSSLLIDFILLAIINSIAKHS